MFSMSQSSADFNDPFPVIGKYDLFQRIYSQIAIYSDFAKKEFVIIKGSPNGKERAENELRILKLCRRCPYIINLIGEISLTDRENLFLIFPYFNQGDLKKYCDNHPPLDGTQIKSIAIHLFEAAKFLERNSIIHRDIKCENILVTSSAFYFTIKLIDFEWAIFYDSVSPPNKRCGTFGYMAPEVFDQQLYAFGADIWSTGVVLFYLFTKSFPFGSRDQHKEYIKNSQEYKYHKKNKSLRSFPKFRKFLKNIFVPQHSGRLTAYECLESNWLQLNSNEALCRLF